jgi:hypothetical protein
MAVQISRRPKRTSEKLGLLGPAGSRIPEREGALEDYFKREAGFTAGSDKARAEARPQTRRESKMRVRMLQTRKGSQDGIHAEIFEAGVAYELEPSLAKAWLERGMCELDRMIDRAPQTGPPAAPAELRQQNPPEAAAPAAKGRIRARGSKAQPAGPDPLKAGG